MGEIGLPRKEVLYELQLWEILAIIRGYRRRSYTIWKASRLQTFYILCAMGYKEAQKPQDLFELPGEEDEPDVEVSDEDISYCQQMIREENERLQHHPE